MAHLVLFISLVTAIITGQRHPASWYCQQYHKFCTVVGSLAHASPGIHHSFRGTLYRIRRRDQSKTGSAGANRRVASFAGPFTFMQLWAYRFAFWLGLG
jgi:hypothetical protein